MPDKTTFDGRYYISIIRTLKLQVRAVGAVLMGHDEALTLGETLGGHDFLIQKKNYTDWWYVIMKSQMSLPEDVALVTSCDIWRDRSCRCLALR